MHLLIAENLIISVRHDSRSWQPTLRGSGKVCFRPPPFIKAKTERFCRREVPWAYGPASRSWHLQHGRRPVEVPPFDVPPIFHEGEGSALPDIRPTCKRCGRSDQRSVKRGNSHRHPGSSAILCMCGVGQVLTVAWWIGRCLQVYLGLRDRIPVWHGRSLALCGSEIPTWPSVQCTSGISSVESVRESVPRGSGSRVTEVPLQFLLAARRVLGEQGGH